MFLFFGRKEKGKREKRPFCFFFGCGFAQERTFFFLVGGATSREK
jgi:hypothetical protein